MNSKVKVFHHTLHAQMFDHTLDAQFTTHSIAQSLICSQVSKRTKIKKEMGRQWRKFRERKACYRHSIREILNSITA